MDAFYKMRKKLQKDGYSTYKKIQEELFHEEQEAEDPDLENIKTGPPI